MSVAFRASEDTDNTIVNMKKSELVRIFSPLLFFLFHVVYLAGWSTDPFLKRWIEGSFTFFVALVMCNVIRTRVLAAKSQGDDGTDQRGDSGGGSRE